MIFSLGNLVALVVSSMVFCRTNGCRITTASPELDMEERLLLSDIIVYGTTAQHVANIQFVNGRRVATIDAKFNIHCVLKQNESNLIPDLITIEKIAPRNGCSGTRDHMQIGTEAIVALKLATNGKYEYHEVIPKLSATFSANRENFFTISSFCGLQNWTSPHDASINKCPICSVANFSQSVLTEETANPNPECILNALVNSSSDCDYFANSSYENSTVCLPVTFTDTCISRSNLVLPTVICECSENGNRTSVANAEVNTGSILTLDVLILLVAMMAVFGFND